MDIVIKIAQHEVAVFNHLHMRDRGFIPRKIAVRCRQKLLRQAQIEVRRLDQQTQDLIEEQAEPLILRVEISIAEIPAIAFEEVDIIADIWLCHA